MKPSEDQAPTVQQLADHLFRHESGKMVSILTGIYGARNLQLAEDVVQDAMIRALRAWPVGGIPENPAAWLLRTARNLAIDRLRRETDFQSKQAALIREIESKDGSDLLEIDESDIRDDQLRLMFVCCHPSLPQEAQVALALKTLCGFSPSEIAKAFLISESAVSKRLVRARQRIRDEGIPFHIPEASERPERIEGVLKTIYLLFNEGHLASHGDEVIRADLGKEALRLGGILCFHSAGNHPSTHALMALMALTAARFPSRTDAQGNLLRLEDQDRGLWDRELIQAGMHHFAESARGNEAGEYHLQAAIAACHTLAASDEATDWPQILSLYGRLMEIRPSAVVALNHAVAISKVHGPDSAIRHIEDQGIRESLGHYHLFHAVLGDLEMKRGNRSVAASHFRKALELAGTKQERGFIADRLEECM